MTEKQNTAKITNSVKLNDNDLIRIYVISYRNDCDTSMERGSKGIRSQVWNIIDFSSCLFLVSDVCSGIGLLAMHILIFISRHGIEPIKRGLSSLKPARSSEGLKPLIQDIIREEWRTNSPLSSGPGDGGWGCLIEAGPGQRPGWAHYAGRAAFLNSVLGACQARALPFSSIFSIFTPILRAMPRLTSPLSWRSITHCLRIISLLLNDFLRNNGMY